MGRNSFLWSCLIILLQPLSAQQYTLAPNAFGANIFSGGIDTPRFQFVDIDGDQDYDLFLFDRDEQLWFYRNVNGVLTIEPKSTFGLTVGSWFRFADIDADGDLDCFTNNISSEVSLYTNTGTKTSPVFLLTHPALTDTSGIIIFSERASIPTFADPDGDGDLDFFTGGSGGSVSYYQNIGTKFSPQFTYITDTYQGINIQGGPSGLPKVMHGASGIEFFDEDSNGVLDLFWGDYFNPSLYFLRNSGTTLNPSIVLTDSTYPNEAVIQSFGFNYPQHVDVNGDGAIDLMVGCVFPNMERNNFMFYANIGTNKAPFYQLQTKNFIPMIDAGSRSVPAMADIDNDGDLDLCVGAADGSFQIYRNSGTKNAPHFSADPDFSMKLPGEFSITVTAGDLNGDLIPDLLLGTFENGLKVYLNTTSGGVISFTHQQHLLETFSLGQSVSPCISDVNGDGKLDVLVGSSGGRIIFVRNTTLNGILSYSVEPNFNSIDVGNDANPFCSDIDKDGRLDLLIGNIEGVLWQYKQNGSDVNKFDLVTQKYDGIDVRLNSAPAAADADGDGDTDLFIGNGKGGILYYESTSALAVSPELINVPSDYFIAGNFPNPFNASTTITYSIGFDAGIVIGIYDMLGRELEILTNVNVKSGRHSVRWNAERFPSGLYLCRLSASNGFSVKNVVHSMILIK